MTSPMSKTKKDLWFMSPTEWLSNGSSGRNGGPLSDTANFCAPGGASSHLHRR
eukprot:CAMPEP_0115730352 /NCGR_PEP_ID=MMETSP0272-20121206/83991_1 /TAXON_ID=71861 /ORGANISM="Scrippsiella trochoidea, Strain CCMP3099" /LENGTH=52 /DNA_ID=CAMNT_0003174087 /DNA_START=263 /DNA_END=418 /DNA_ORIENTATION=-